MTPLDQSSSLDVVSDLLDFLHLYVIIMNEFLHIIPWRFHIRTRPINSLFLRKLLFETVHDQHLRRELVLTAFEVVIFRLYEVLGKLLNLTLVFTLLSDVSITNELFHRPLHFYSLGASQSAIVVI